MYCLGRKTRNRNGWIRRLFPSVDALPPQQATTSPRGDEVDAKESLSISLEPGRKTTFQQQQSESVEGATASIGGLPDTSPLSRPSPLPGSPDRNGTVVSAAAAGSGTSDPGNGDDGSGGGRNDTVDVDELRQHPSSSISSSLIGKSLAYLPDRTSALMDELLSAAANRSSGGKPTGGSVGRSGRGPGKQVSTCGDPDAHELGVC